jgi:preprotein translocase subunit YajC
MLISPAYAQAAGGDAGGLLSFLPLVLIFAVFYFLLIRPQQKKMKQHREMIGNIRRNDRVVTGGGIIGKVTKVVDGEDKVEVEIANNVVVQVARGTIGEVIAKSAPAASGSSKAKPAHDTGSGSGQGGVSGFLSKLRGEK